MPARAGGEHGRTRLILRRCRERGGEGRGEELSLSPALSRLETRGVRQKNLRDLSSSVAEAMVDGRGGAGLALKVFLIKSAQVSSDQIRR